MCACLNLKIYKGLGEGNTKNDYSKIIRQKRGLLLFFSSVFSIWQFLNLFSENLANCSFWRRLSLIKISSFFIWAKNQYRMQISQKVLPDSVFPIQNTPVQVNLVKIHYNCRH